MPHTLFPCRRPAFVLGWWLAFVVLFAGCSDVRGETDGAHMLTVDGWGSSYLAFQDGSGAWRPLATPPAEGAPYKLTLSDPQGRYGVMHLCLDEATGNLSVDVRHAVLSETPVVTATCPGEAVRAGTEGGLKRMSGRVSGLGGGEYGNVYLGDASALVDSSVPEHRLELRGARHDLIATRYAQGERVPSRLVFEPGVAVTDGGTAHVDFGGPYAFTPETATLPLRGVRPDELLSGAVEVVTRTGTVALVGEYLGGEYPGDGALHYARLPEALMPGAVMRAAAHSFSYDDPTRSGSSRSVTRTFSLGASPPLVLPPPLARPLISLHLTRTVCPEARWRAHPAGAGVYTQFYSQIRDRQARDGQLGSGRSVSYRLSQSSAWLSGRPYSYTLPDFSTLPGWLEAWDLGRDDDLFWEVSFSRSVGVSTRFASRSGVLTP